MNKQKKNYCIDTLANRFDALSPEELAKQAKELLFTVSETELETLMRKYGKSPDAYLLPRKDEIIKALENASEIAINVVYEDYRDDEGKESFAHLEDKELLTDAVALAALLEENGEDEEALRFLRSLHKIDFDFRFYNEYEDEPMDYDSRSFADISFLLPNGSRAKEAYLKLILKRNDYESASVYFDTYHPSLEALDCVSPAFADGFLTFVEANSIHIDDRFALFENLLAKLEEGTAMKHIEPLGQAYPGVLKECLKRFGGKTDLRPIVNTYLGKEERLDSSTCAMLRAAIKRYPDENAYIRRYYHDGYYHDLDAMFLFLSLPEVTIHDIKKEDRVFFKMESLVSFYGFEEKARLLSIFFIGPETNADDALGETVWRGQNHYLELAEFDERKLLGLIEKNMISRTERSSSRHYYQIATEVTKLNAAVNGTRDFASALLDAFPNRPALRKALLECATEKK